VCAVCAAPKRRFKPYELPVAKNANDVRVRKARKEELKKSDLALGFVPFFTFSFFFGVHQSSAMFNPRLLNTHHKQKLEIEK
jgi:hypothetical protein